MAITHIQVNKEHWEYLQMREQYFQQTWYNGSESMEYPYLRQFDQAGDMIPNGNNYSSPFTTRVETSVVSKPKTLMFNERARRSITTPEKKQEAGQFMEPDPFL